MALSPSASIEIILPKKKSQAGGQSLSPTFQTGREFVTVPRYREHLDDLFTKRTAADSRSLLIDLSRHDSDVSASIFAYQSISGSADWTIKAYNLEGEIDTDGIKLAHQILDRLTTTNDYSLGYSGKASFSNLNDDMRYWALLRGSPGAELILNKKYEPDSVRFVDMARIEWQEKVPGVYKPFQLPTGSGAKISLDIPTFFTARFNQNPTDIYSYSPFVAAINTIAARQQVINDLYRITQVLGYPRMDIKVLEEVLLRSAPALLRSDEKKLRDFINNQVNDIRSAFASLKAEDALVHTDSVEVSIVNDSKPATTLPIQNVIEVLDQQNQAALKTMPAVIGKGNGSGQTASVEARLFAMNCDALNRIVADVWTQMLNFATRLAGFQGSIEFIFDPVELRPIMELEPQKTMLASRLMEALSYGFITDDEFHLTMFKRPRPQSSPELSGTNFRTPTESVAVDTQDVTPNNDPLGRSITPEGGTKQARSKAVKSGSS